MAYEPTNWKTGDVVTSAKLNKLENAVANGGALKLNFIVDKGAGTTTIDKTYAEIKEAVLSGVYVFGVLQDDSPFIIVYPCQFEESTDPEDEYYSIGISGFSIQPMWFNAETENDYPVFSKSGGGEQ